MGIPGSVNPLLLATQDTQYIVSRSLRFNSSDSAYCSRVFSSAGNRRTATLSFWLKRSNFSADQTLFSCGSTGGEANEFEVFFGGNGADISIRQKTSNTFSCGTTAVFRDPSAWYHIVISVDTTQATAANRLKLYVNNVEQVLSGTLPTQNTDLGLGSATTWNLGRRADAVQYINGYLAEVQYLCGSALTPSSFAETNATTGQWVPKAYAGSYGTCGFKLDFSDNSAATAAALGKDTSGNGNNFSPFNLSVTAGAGNDSLVDTPTSYGTGNSGGDVRGNYCTLNPILENGWWAAPNRGSISNGNLTLSQNNGTAFSTFNVADGNKWYAEITITSYGQSSASSSIVVSAKSRSTFEVTYYASGSKQTNGGGVSSYGASWTTGDVIGVAIDSANNQITFYKNGVSQGAISNTFPSQTVLLGYYAEATGTDTVDFNFGQRSWAYAAPSGFKALCDTNLPAGSISTSGSFTGNANADGPFVWLNGVPTAMTINGNVVTFGTHADKLSNGFKLRTNSTSYNASGSNTYSVSTTGSKFVYARGQANP